MRFHLFVLVCGSATILLISTTAGNEAGNETPTEETTTDADESTQKILPPEPEVIDEFYNYQEPLDEFNHYKPTIVYDWKHVEEAYNVKDIQFLRYLCTRVHELAGWGRVNVTNKFLMENANIVYKNPMYFPTDMKYLQYDIWPAQKFADNVAMDRFYLAEGLKEDCVFYLTPILGALVKSFHLHIHVCGVHRALKGENAPTTNATAQA